jgi:hypothetical protein
MALAEPPVLITSYPSFARPAARSVMPVLSETEMSARGLAPLGEAYLEGDADATTPRRAEREEETREPATDSDDGDDG